MMNQRNLDLSAIAAQVGTFTLNVNDYEMLTPSLAKVVITTTGEAPSKSTIHQQMAKLFNGLASAVDDSFRMLTRSGDVKSIVGFVKANREVKPYEEQEVTAKMKVMASNLLMDQEDKSLWEVREGASGRYLCRQGQDELSELVHLATASKVGVPHVSQLAMASVLKNEIAAYVNVETEEVEHGFVIQANKTNTEFKILPFGSDTTIAVAGIQLVHVEHLDAEDQPKGMEMASGLGKEDSIAYYKKLYAYAPDYVQAIIEQINQMSYA